jgi:Trk K+ transport system NAD-binding subunit
MHRQLKAAWQLTRAAISRVRWPLFGLLVALMTGTLAFSLEGSKRPIQAFFYSVNLITLNAGPGDAPEPIWLQAVAFLIVIIGVLSLAGGATRIIQLMSDPKERQLALASTLSDHIIICGIGRVGYRVINELLEFGEKVVAINVSEKEEWLPDFIKRGVVIIMGDARQRRTLVNAGIERASALIACTSDDLTNLDIALDARDANPKIKVVLRMFDTALAAKVSKGFNINTAFSVSALAAPALAAAATRAKVDYSFKLKGRLLNVTSVTFAAGSPFLGKTLGQVEQEVDCSVISQETDDGLCMHPPQDHMIQTDERFNIVGSLEAIKLLHSN